MSLESNLQNKENGHFFFGVLSIINETVLFIKGIKKWSVNYTKGAFQSSILTFSFMIINEYHFQHLQKLNIYIFKVVYLNM